MTALPVKPIDALAKDGRDVIVNRGDNYARAYWTGGEMGMWAYGALPKGAAVEQIDFEPTLYADVRQ